MSHECRLFSSPDPSFGRRWHVTCADCGRITRAGISKGAAEDIAAAHAKGAAE